MKPRKEQIEAEIAKLKKMQPRVRRYSMFGNDNRAAVLASIITMERNLSEDDIWDYYAETDHMRDAAIHARQWLDGDEKESPSDSWQSLVE